MPYVETSIFVDKKPDLVYDFAKDMERYPEYMSDVESVKVIERKESETLSEWVTNIEGTPIVWIERDSFDDISKKISYQLIEGDLDKFEGTWSFAPENSGTRITLGVDFDFGIPHLEELIGPTLVSKVKENSDMMLNGIKSYFEK